MPATQKSPSARCALPECGVLIYCTDYRCGHWTRLDADRWPDDVRLSDIEPSFTCTACGCRGADVRPDWQSVEGYGKDAASGQNKDAV